MQVAGSHASSRQPPTRRSRCVHRSRITPAALPMTSIGTDRRPILRAMLTAPDLDPKAVRRQFSRRANSPGRADFLFAEVEARMLERLDLVRFVAAQRARRRLRRGPQPAGAEEALCVGAVARPGFGVGNGARRARRVCTACARLARASARRRRSATGGASRRGRCARAAAGRRFGRPDLVESGAALVRGAGARGRRVVPGGASGRPGRTSRSSASTPWPNCARWVRA